MGKSETEIFTGKIVSACMCEWDVQYISTIYTAEIKQFI